MPKFKRDDKIKFRPDAEKNCKKGLGDRWFPKWQEASAGQVGKILGATGVKNGAKRWSVMFPCNGGSSMWVYEDMITLNLEEECMTDLKDLYKKLDKLIKG